MEEQGLSGTLGEGVLKMSSSLLVVLKGIRPNNLYYVKGSAVTKNVAALERLKDDSTKLWQMRLGHIGLDSLEALAK